MPTAFHQTSSPSRSQHRGECSNAFSRQTSDTNLTIYRGTKSHHGRSLQILGHAAQYLADSSLFLTETADLSDQDAIRLLMRLSREVFDDYAAATHQRHPVAYWIMSQAVRIYGAA
jgi:hypothetical protein